MVSKIKVAFALLLVTLVSFARATSDDEVMLDFPAFHTLAAAPRRYLRSSESMITTHEGNGEERMSLHEYFAKLLPKKETKPLDSEMMMSFTKKSDEANALKEESQKVKMLQDKSKNKLSFYEVLKKWWASIINWILRKDAEVKRLVKNVNEITDKDEINRITSILYDKHMQRWYNMRRSAEDIHHLLGLKNGVELLKSPLLHTWVDYSFFIGRNFPYLDTIKVFEEKFGDDILVAKMFENLKEAHDMKMSAGWQRFETEFLQKWLEQEHDLQQFQKGLLEAGFSKKRVKYFVKEYKKFHPNVEARKWPVEPNVSDAAGHGHGRV